MFTPDDRDALAVYYNDTVAVPDQYVTENSHLPVPFVSLDAVGAGKVEAEDVPFWLLKAPEGQYGLVDNALASLVILPTLEDALAFLTVRTDPHATPEDRERVSGPVIDIRTCPTIPRYFGIGERPSAGASATNEGASEDTSENV